MQIQHFFSNSSTQRVFFTRCDRGALIPSCAERVTTLQPIRWQHIKRVALQVTLKTAMSGHIGKIVLYMLNTTNELYSMHYVKKKKS